MNMKSVLASLLIAGSLALAPRGQAGTHTWIGGSTDGRWSVGANWAGGSPPVAFESPLHLVFSSSATRRLSTNNIPNITIDSISFGGAAYTIAASGTGTNVTFNSSVGHSYWNVLATNGTGHAIHYSMNLALNGSLECNIATNCTVTFRSRLSAASANSGLSKDGPGTVSLDPIEDNTFDGFTTIADGTLQLEGSHTQFGFTVTDVTVPGPLIIGGNSLSQHPVCVVWQGNQIADSSAVTVNRNGQLLLADVNDTIGSLTMAGGIVDTANGKLTLNGNVLVQNPPSGTPSQFLGYLDLGQFGRFFTVETSAQFYISAVISGGSFGNAAAGVTKLGPGWMSLSSPSNTFGGYLQVNAGTLSFSSEKQLGAHTNGVGVASNAVLVLGGIGTGPTVDNETLSLAGGAVLKAGLDSVWNAPVILYGKAIIDVPTNTTLEINGVISGPGGFNKVNTGELLLTGFDDNTFTGVACVDNGILSLDKAGLFTNAIAISGPLVVGGMDATKSPVAVLFADEEIAPTVQVIVNQNGELDLGSHKQTVGALAVNAGIVDSGILGLLKLAGDLTSTNDLTHYGDILGRLDLGNSPRSISVLGNGGWLNVHAIISGGPAASLSKNGWSNLQLFAANTYEGLTIINDGSVVAAHPRALGSPIAGTAVNFGGSLILDSFPYGHPSMTVTNEALSLTGSAYDDGTFGAALYSNGTNNWFGVVTLIGSDVVIRANEPEDQLVLSVRVEGVRNLTKTGKGKLIFSGVGSPSFNNTYTGATTVADGELLLAKQGFLFANTALAGDLNIVPAGPGAFPTVRVQGRQQFWGTNAVTIAPGGWLRIETPTFNSIGSLAGNGVVDFAPGSRLVCGINNLDATFAGTLQGGGVNDTNFVKYGNGILTLTGANGLSSRVHVGGGTLRVNSTQPIGRYDVTTPGSLGGIGSIYNVMMRGGYLAPGSPLGKLHADSLTIAANHWMYIDINGPTLGTDYDQFEVDDAPNLNFTTLGTAFANGFNPVYGQEFIILRNNSASPVIGHFEGLDEGAKFNVDNTHRVQITYLGGDGNDVVLKTVAGAGQFKGISTDGNRVFINGSGTPGATYHVQATTTIADPASWVDLGTVIAGADGLMQYVGADMATYPHRFYRFAAP